MRLYRQFDLNLENLKINNFNDVPRAINEIPILVEKLIKNLSDKGYEVVKEGVHFTGLPQSITIIKDFTGPFVTNFSIKVKDDFDALSKTLGIESLFE
ncbi:hypothetical protein HYX00_06690 [Candidatus Woesearchaeota archaeon]|nr:hypothetical protein [Candidatus Woesearchaeota archaeon]